MATGQHTVLAGIAVYEHRLVPRRGYLSQEVEAKLGGPALSHLVQVLRSYGEVLDGILEEHGGGQFVCVGGATVVASLRGVVAAVERATQETASELHAAYRVAQEGMERGVPGLHVAEVLVEVQVLAGQHRLAAHVVGVHALPATGQGATVEDDHQPVVVGIGEYLLVETHGLLLVAAEEVHLDALHADTLHPAHGLLAQDGVTHHVDGTLLDVVPPAAGAVPEEQLYALRTSVVCQLAHTLVTDVAVPPVVDEHVGIAHRLRQTDVLHLVVPADTVVLPEYPAPGALAELVGVLRREARGDVVPRRGGLHDGLQRRAHGNGAPGGVGRQGHGRLHGAVAVVLAGHGELMDEDTEYLMSERSDKPKVSISEEQVMGIEPMIKSGEKEFYELMPSRLKKIDCAFKSIEETGDNTEYSADIAFIQEAAMDAELFRLSSLAGRISEGIKSGDTASLKALHRMFMQEWGRTYRSLGEKYKVTDSSHEPLDPALKTVLLIDDDDMMRGTIKSILGKNYNVLSAESAEKALAILEENNPDLVLLDYEMPVCDGPETYRLIRGKEKCRDIPVIFMTGAENADQLGHMKELTGQPHISKIAGAVRIRAT